MNRQLEQELHDLAAPIELDRGDIGAVIERAQQRRHRMRGSLAVVTTVSVAAAAVIVADAARHNPSHTGANGKGTAISLGEPKPAAKPLVWRQVPVTSTLGLAGGQASGNGPIYALSTAPGDSSTNFNRNTVYKSVDGIDWNEVASPGNDLFLSNLSPTDNRIYAVGTGPATADAKGEALYAGWSDDGAKTWSKQALPLDFSALDPSLNNVGVSSASIAAGSHGSVIVAQLSAPLNVQSLLPAGVTTPHGYFQTDKGVEILGADKPCPAGTSATAPASSKFATNGLRAKAAAKLGAAGLATVKVCFGADGTLRSLAPDQAHEVVRTLTWHDLGVTGDVLAVVRGDAFVFAARPGSTKYERVDLPQLTNVASFAIAATDDGFDLVAALDAKNPSGASTGGMIALHSTDGRNWTESDNVPAGVDAVYGVGQFDGSIVVFGDRGFATPAVFIENASGGWTMTSLADVAGNAAPSGTNVSLVDGAVGTFGLVAEVIVTPNVKIGNTKTTLPPTRPANNQTGYLLLSSPDGQSWSTTTLDSLAGPHSAIQRLDQIGDHVVVVASVKNPGDTEAKHVAFVGTPGS
jgi:hypothetical protein